MGFYILSVVFYLYSLISNKNYFPGLTRLMYNQISSINLAYQ